MRRYILETIHKVQECIMSKEPSPIEIAVVAAEYTAIDIEPAKLDDLCLALVGGGQCVVTF